MNDRLPPGGVAGLEDLRAIESVPLAARGLPSSTLALLERGASVRGHDAPALHFFLDANAYDRTVTLTYAQLIADVRRFANALHEAGVRQRDVVSLMLPNLPETFVALLGAETAGIANPINPLLEPEVIAEIMNAAGSTVLVTLPPLPRTDFWDKVEVVRRRVPTLRVIVRVDMSRYLPAPLRWVARGASRLHRAASGSQRLLDYHREVARQPGDRLVFERDIRPDDIASYFHTGGTTGVPKLAAHTHGNEVFDAWSGAAHVGTRSDQVLFCGLPLFHVNGVVVTGLSPWVAGATVVLGTPRGYRGAGVIANFWKITEHYRLTNFSGVPTVFAALLDVPVADSDISSLEYAICGAAPMPVELFRRFEERTGVKILEGYGLTEGTCACAANPPRGERKVGSIGLPFPYQEMMVGIRDASGGYLRDAAVDEIGSVLLRGPAVFPGYRDERHEQGIWVDRGDGGPPWFDTGDLGRCDAGGYFWLTGRRKELIIRGGHNIDPALIEEPMVGHPRVSLAAAVGRPDARVGEVPVVYVQLEHGASATEAELLEYAAARIGERAAVPRAVHIVDELPLTAVGKIFKPALRRREVADALREAVIAVDGVASAVVTVETDASHGDLARVTVKPAPEAEPESVRAAAATALGAFAVAHAVELQAR